jgi:hypothetical protein
MTESRTSALPPEPTETVEELPALDDMTVGVIMGERGRR